MPRKILLATAALASIIGLYACTDTKMAKLTTFGKPAEITCWSGGQVVYHGHSTGRINNSEGSDGYEFVDASERTLTHISGECKLVYDK
jgi:hypothetical protein